MNRFTHGRRCIVARLIAPALAVGGLGGCQSYRSEPLDLPGHWDSVSRRLIDEVSIPRHAMTPDAMHARTPDRFDLSDGISPAEGEAIALVYNPDLRLARLDAGVALATFETAGMWEDPQFGFDGAEILSPSGPFEYGLKVGLTLPVSGRLGIEKHRAGAAYEAQLRRVADAEWSLRAEVRSAWARWTAAVERVRLLSDAADRVGRIIAVTNRLEYAGELTRVESRLIRSQAIEARTQLASGLRAATQARNELLAMMGLPPDAGIELVAGYPTCVIPSAPDEIGRLIELNTELAVHRAEYQIAEESLRLEIRRQYPDIAIGGGYGNEGDDRLLLGVSVPIPIFNANRGAIAEARARRERARAAAETVFERLTHELAAARAELESVRMQRRTIESELVPMLDEQSVEVERLADLGEVDALLLIETVARGIEAQKLLIDLRAAEIVAESELARILGPDPSSIATPVSDTDRSHTLNGVPQTEENSR